MLCPTDSTELIDELAQMNFQAWKSTLKYLSLESWRNFYRNAALARGKELPITLVASVGNRTSGTISIDVQDDLAEFHDCTPWICALVVDPGFRGQGTGTALMRAACEKVRELGEPVAYLWTYDQAEMYSALGWKAIGQIIHCGKLAIVMRWDVEPDA